jgi:uncharacterized membrane protein
MQQKRYWLRGGTAGLMVGILVVVFLPIVCPYITYDIHGSTAGTHLCNSIWPYTFFLFVLLSSIAFESTFIFSMYFVIIFTIFGVLLGWLYGKIKKRGQIGA